MGKPLPGGKLLHSVAWCKAIAALGVKSCKRMSCFPPPPGLSQLECCQRSVHQLGLVVPTVDGVLPGGKERGPVVTSEGKNPVQPGKATHRVVPAGIITEQSDGLQRCGTPLVSEEWWCRSKKGTDHRKGVTLEGEQRSTGEQGRVVVRRHGQITDRTLPTRRPPPSSGASASTTPTSPGRCSTRPCRRS